jgi:anion-transporting  ArsA/GET3 family ATPase
VSSVRLWFGLVHMRFGSLHWFGLFLLTVGLLAHGFLTPRVEHLTAALALRNADPDLKSNAQLLQLQHIRERLAAQQSDLQNQLAFRAVLVEQRRLPDELSQVLAAVESHGLAMARVDYKRSDQRDAGISVLEVRLPVRGSYFQVRQFIESVLVQHPGAAFQEIGLERVDIGASEVLAKLKLSIYLQLD